MRDDKNIPMKHIWNTVKSIKIARFHKSLTFSREMSGRANISMQSTSRGNLTSELDIHVRMFRILNWSPSITRRIMARQGRLCDATHDCLLSTNAPILQFVSARRSPLKARGLQITGASTLVPSCRDVKLWSPFHLQLSRPPTLAFLSALDLLEKLGARPRDVNMPPLSVLFAPRFPPRMHIFYRKGRVAYWE